MMRTYISQALENNKTAAVDLRTFGLNILGSANRRTTMRRPITEGKKSAVRLNDFNVHRRVSIAA